MICRIFNLKNLIKYDNIIFLVERILKNPIFALACLMPKIIGVVVTYEGNQSSITKENILNAIMALTGLGANKIQVFDK